MPKPKRPLKVFLCHAHMDREAVYTLYTHLTNDGVDVWLDKEKLLGGEDWEYEIRNAVRESDIVVVCHSKQFNQKGFRQKEVKIALEEADLLPKGEIFIIPVRLEECDVLDELKRWHWVDLFESNGYERLLRALFARADRIGAIFQVKRGWLPRITTSPAKYKRPAEIKNSEELKGKPIYKMGEIPDDEPPDKFPAGWDTEWMPSADPEKAKIEGGENAEHEAATKKIKKQLSSKRTFNTTSFISVMALVFCVASVILIPILSSLSNKYEPTPEPQIKLTNTVEVLSLPSSTVVVYEIPSLTLPPVITATPTPLPTEITDAKGVIMRLVPSGEFTMGSDNWGEFVHQVYLDAFYMDKYEVTNFLYSVCVDEGVCSVPPQYAYHYKNSNYKNHPVVYVNWGQAKTYCNWRDGNLPTEAQWEKAARGTDGRSYPWREGEGIDCYKANYLGGVNYGNGCVGDTTKVGIYEFGKSPYGIYDLAGNVMEWTADWYLDSYYLVSPYSNPQGAVSGTFRVVRGGSWNYPDDSVSSVGRNAGNPDWGGNDTGFRCVNAVTP